MKVSALKAAIQKKSGMRTSRITVLSIMMRVPELSVR